MTPSWAGKPSLLHQRNPELIEKYSGFEEELKGLKDLKFYF